MDRDTPSFDQLREFFRYDKETGLIYFRTTKFRRRAGNVAGVKNRIGYVYVRFRYKAYLAHRVAWLLTTGKWPVDQIDHINGIRDDNRIDNLRECNAIQNAANVKKKTVPNSGVRGVTTQKGTKRFRSRIDVGRKRIHLGYFNTKEEASAAYRNAAIEFNGEFAHPEIAADNGDHHAES